MTAHPLPSSAVRPDRTLVLGGNGFLGAHVVRAALAHGASEPEPCVYSASRGPEFTALPEGALARSLDALSVGALEALCDELLPARVILCTALSRIADCEAYPGLARELNVAFAERAARWCAAHDARLVHVSTDLVFGAGAPPAGGYTERDLPRPVSVYGRTKAAGESAVLATWPAALVVRLPLLYGSSGGRGLGASDSVLAAVERGERPRLFTDEWRTPIAVEGAGAVLVALAHADVAGTLHLAGLERVTRYELGVRVLESRGLSRGEAERAVEPATRAGLGLDDTRPADVSLATERAWSLLGASPPSIAESLRGARVRATERRPA